MKKIILFLLSIISIGCFAQPNSGCGLANNKITPEFCESFKKVAICNCATTLGPICEQMSMKQIYDSMIGRLKTVERACAFQHDVSTQECIYDWQCYHLGGDTPDGRCLGKKIEEGNNWCEYWP